MRLEEKNKTMITDRRILFDKKHTTMLSIKLNNRTDADIIEFLEKQENKAGTIKKLIRDHLLLVSNTDI